MDALMRLLSKMLLAFAGLSLFVPRAAAQEESAFGFEGDWLGAEIADLVSAFDGDRSIGAMVQIALMLLLLAMLTVAVRRWRDGLPRSGWIPSLIAAVHFVLRIVLVGLGLTLAVRVLPPRLSLVVVLSFAGFAVALGWSARDVLVDLVAGFVIVFERRVRRGMWVSGEGFSGQVEQVSLRSTAVRDPQGHRVSVPNRRLLEAPVTSDPSHEREHEVVVSIDSSAPAEEVRAALRDAVLASPWVFPGAKPVVLRDAKEPHRWRVRGRLLEAAYGGRFEGDLLERAEALLAHGPGSLQGAAAEDAT